MGGNFGSGGVVMLFSEVVLCSGVGLVCVVIC